MNSIIHNYRKVNERTREGQEELRTILMKNKFQGGEMNRKSRRERGRERSM